MDRKQISLPVEEHLLEEHPHHVAKGYSGVEKLSVLVTKTMFINSDVRQDKREI